MKPKNYNLAIGLLIICLILFVVALIYLEKNSFPNIPPINNQSINLSECIVRSNIVLYGRTNSRVFLAQQEDLGEIFDIIPFIDCLNERDKCEGILLVPAWKINDQIYYGSFSEEILIKLMGCE